MQDLLLLGVVAAAFVFGYLVVKRLDCFLDDNQQPSKILCLRIGLSNPLAANSLSDILEWYSKEHPDTSVSFLSGTEKELMQALTAHKLDMVFLPVDTAAPEKTHANIREISLSLAPLIEKYTGLPIEPMTEEPILQKLVWPDAELTPAASSFIAYLKADAALPEQKK